jgi:hypothetical protein
VTNLRVILLEVEPISRLRQGISFKFNQMVSTLLQDLFHNERSEPHGFELACPQGIFVLIIDQDKIAFRENPRMNGLIILTLDSFLMSLIGRGCITTLLIELLEI